MYECSHLRERGSKGGVVCDVMHAAHVGRRGGASDTVRIHDLSWFEDKGGAGGDQLRRSEARNAGY